MIEIQELLAPLADRIASGELKKETIRNAIIESTHITLTPEAVQIKNGTVYLEIKPIYKNEVFLKKDLILTRLQEGLGNHNPSDIR